MAAESTPLTPLIVEIFKTLLLIILALAVYTAHLDLQSQLLRFHRRKHVLNRQRGTATARKLVKPNLPTIIELPTSTDTFKPAELGNLLPNNSYSSSHIDIPNFEDLPPPAQDL